MSGGTLTVGGTLSVNGNSVTGGAGAAAGSAFGAGMFMQGSGTITFQPGSGETQTFSNAIADQSGSGGAGAWGLTKAGTGTLVLSAANAYTGGTAINAGTLSVGANNNLGTASGGLSFGGGTLQFSAGFATNRAVTLNAGGGTIDTNGNNNTLSGAIGGTGSLTKVGTGILTLSAAGTYAGSTAINAGTLQVGGANLLSSGSAFTVTSGAVLNLNNFNQTIGSLAGAGNVTLGTAALTAGGNNSSTTFSGVISDTGSLVKAGTGTLTLTGTNTHSGGTTINAGTLVIGADSNLGNASGALTFGGGALRFTSAFTSNRSVTLNGGGGTFDTNGNNDTLGGVIGGTGPLTKSGAGTLTLTGANAYTGATTVNAGNLIVNGSIDSSSALTVNNSALIGGNGILPTTTIASGGMLSPGNSIGTITVQGNLTFTSGGVYIVEVGTTADRTNVTGTAALAGTVFAIIQPGAGSQRSHTILSSAGLGGTTFNSLATNLPGGFITTLSYTPTDVMLNVTAGLSGSTTNGQNVATALNSFFNSGGTLTPGFLSVYGLTGDTLNSALAQISGELGATAIQTGTQMMNAFLYDMLNPYSGAPGGNPGSVGYARAFGAADHPLPKEAADAYGAIMPAKAAGAQAQAAFAQRWSVWGQSLRRLQQDQRRDRRRFARLFEQHLGRRGRRGLSRHA